MQKWSKRWVYLAIIPMWIYCLIHGLNNIYLGLSVVTASILIVELYNHFLLRINESVEQINALKVIWNRFIPFYLYGTTIFIIFISTNGDLDTLDKAAIWFASGFGILSLIYNNIDIRSIFAFRSDRLMLNEVVWSLAYDYFTFMLVMLMTSSLFITEHIYVMYGFIAGLFIAIWSTRFVINSYYSKRPK